MGVIRELFNVLTDEELVKAMARSRALYFKTLIDEGIHAEYAIQLAVGSIQNWQRAVERGLSQPTYKK